MEASRRRILQTAGPLRPGAWRHQPVLDALRRPEALRPQPKIGPAKDALTAKQWAMVIDTRKFESDEDVEPLIEACHSIHNVPEVRNQTPRDQVDLGDRVSSMPSPGTVAPGSWRRASSTAPFLVLCNHCENPPCVRVCPTKATFKRASDGIVMMDFHRCIGCRFCMAACPFGARSFNFRDPRPFITETNKTFPTRMKGVVEKCNFCAERLAVGKLPACVEASEGNLDLRRPVRSGIRGAGADQRPTYTIRRKTDLGTEPAVYYIV